MSYLPQYGNGPGNKIVIVKVHPRDIVSVPVDYNHAKVRCCRYEVLSEYTGDDRDDLLGSKAVWSDSDFRDEDDWEDNSEDDWDNEVCNSCGEYTEDCECGAPEVTTEHLNDREEQVDAFGLEVPESPFGVFEESLNHLTDVLGPDPKDLPSALQESLDALDSIDARTKAIYDSKVADDELRRLREIEVEHAKLLAESRETALRDFHYELDRFAEGSVKIWMDDAKKAPNLPTSDEVQKMLGNLAADLRRAEIAAGDPKNFDWEAWLNERDLSVQKVMEFAKAARDGLEEGQALVSAETEAQVAATLELLRQSKKD